jgi:imidazolonepropionase-like amidohydrolase
MAEGVAGLGHRVPALLNAPAVGTRRLYLHNASLFDGVRRSVRESSSVLIEDGRITRVGNTSDPPPEGAIAVDLQARTLMPGLTNCHLHLVGPKPERLPGAEEILEGTSHHALQSSLRDYIRYGVTTVRDMGSHGDQPQAARQAMRYGLFRGPRILTCARIISATAPGGRFYAPMYREADGPDDCRRAVREQVRMGADLVKVMTTGVRGNELEDPEPTQLTDHEFAAIVDEAHRLGYRVAAHAEGLPGVEAAIHHSMDTVEHGIYLHQRPDLLEKMAQNGQFLIPTITAYYELAGYGEAIDTEGVAPRGEMLPMLVELAVYNLSEGSKTVRAALRAGVKIALGSDGHPNPRRTALELLRMIHQGLSPAEALIAATSTAADALGLSSELGTVEAGKYADLIVLDGNPVNEPELLLDPARVWLVFQLGAPVAGTAFESRTESADLLGGPETNNAASERTR